MQGLHRTQPFLNSVGGEWVHGSVCYQRASTATDISLFVCVRDQCLSGTALYHWIQERCTVWTARTDEYLSCTKPTHSPEEFQTSISQHPAGDHTEMPKWLDGSCSSSSSLPCLWCWQVPLHAPGITLRSHINTALDTHRWNTLNSPNQDSVNSV